MTFSILKICGVTTWKTYCVVSCGLTYRHNVGNKEFGICMLVECEAGAQCFSKGVTCWSIYKVLTKGSPVTLCFDIIYNLKIR